MARYSFILTVENRDKLLKEGLNIEQRLVNKSVSFDDNSSFYNSSTNCGFIYPIGAFSSSRSGDNLFKVGNYCTIDGDIRIMQENHPFERFTVSPLTYQPNGGERAAVVHSNKIGLVPNPPKHAFGERIKHFRINSEVRIRTNCLLANNIKIGKGAVIEANSLVVKDVPPYAIVAGNPAKIVAYRFNEKIIDKLLETSWSEYDITAMDIKGDIPVEQFIDLFYEYKDKGKIKPIILKNLKEVLDKLKIAYASV